MPVMRATHRSLARGAALAFGAFYSVARLRNPEYWDLLDDVNLAVHESGHVVFGLFGDPLHTLGGSLLQVVVPLAFVGYFFRSRQRFAAAFTLFWVGASMLNVAHYIGDAQAQALPLLGGENVVHDWWFLLTGWDLLPRDGAIAGLVQGWAALCMASALGGGLATMRESSAGPASQRFSHASGDASEIATHWPPPDR